MSDYLEDSFKRWIPIRDDAIAKLRDLADEIQKHENNSRIAILFGSSASATGTIVTFASLVATICTAGAALPIMLIVGSITALLGGITSWMTQGVNYYLRRNTLKVINAALLKDEKNTTELNDALQKFAREKLPAKLYKKGLYSAQGGAIAAGGICTIAKGGVQLSETAIVNGTEGMFFAFSTLNQVFHGLGLGVCGLSLAFDIFTIVKNSIAVHNGKLLPVVERIREIADALEKEKHLNEQRLRKFLNELNEG